MKAIPYTSFTDIKATLFFGWKLGFITSCQTSNMESITGGDVYYISPKNERVGLAWAQSNRYRFNLMLRSEKNRWGVFDCEFPDVIRSEDDFECISNEFIIPNLIRYYKIYLVYGKMNMKIERTMKLNF